MSYSKRIERLCAHLKKTDVFADVGCDHGYCTEYMLDNGLCSFAFFCDISKGSLQKAEKLLQGYVEQGKAKGVLGGGFCGLHSEVDEVLIAGMGGSEILGILTDKKYGFIPKYFVFQPMHDCEKLRKYLVESGANILHDYTFYEGKYYDVIVGERGNGKTRMQYSEEEYAFGRDNVRTLPEAFVARSKKMLEDIKAYLKNPTLQPSSRLELEERYQKLTGVLQGETSGIL